MRLVIERDEQGRSNYATCVHAHRAARSLPRPRPLLGLSPQDRLFGTPNASSQTLTSTSRRLLHHHPGCTRPFVPAPQTAARHLVILVSPLSLSVHRWDANRLFSQSTSARFNTLSCNPKGLMHTAFEDMRSKGLVQPGTRLRWPLTGRILCPRCCRRYPVTFLS